MLFYSDLGIVLKKIPAGEKNEVVILLTKEHGKMAFMAYGSRDPKSRKTGSLQLFNTIDFQARGSRSHLPAIKEVTVITARAGRILEQDKKLNTYFRACEIVKLMDGLTKELQGGGKGFDDLEAALDHVQAPGITLLFQIRLLSDFGFLPDFRTCVHCHVKINLQDTVQFSTENKGFAHQRCCQEKADKYSDGSAQIDSTIYKGMVYFQRATIEQAVKVKMNAMQMKRIKELLERVEL